MSKRNLIAFAMVFCLFCGVIAQVPAQDDPCQMVQAEAQALVGNESEGDWKNHGQYVSTVARLVDQYVESAEIDSVCASCIVSQFARRIPVEEQEPCGL